MLQLDFSAEVGKQQRFTSKESCLQEPHTVSKAFIFNEHRFITVGAFHIPCASLCSLFSLHLWLVHLVVFVWDVARLSTSNLLGKPAFDMQNIHVCPCFYLKKVKNHSHFYLQVFTGIKKKKIRCYTLGFLQSHNWYFFYKT